MGLKSQFSEQLIGSPWFNLCFDIEHDVTVSNVMSWLGSS